MKRRLLAIWLTLSLLRLATAAPLRIEGKPYVQGRFQGRIAYSCDGNHNDRDDWMASPVTLAILAEAGLKDCLVHFDYNCILPLTDPDWEKTHAESVLGAVERYGYDKSMFFDCRKKLNEAVADLAKAVNQSSAENPLYLIIAGPVEVPYLGVQKADPAKRPFVYCLSHSRWNDGYASKYKFTFTKRSVIEQGVHWIQICDQNKLLSLSPYGRPARPEEFGGFFWMRDSLDPKVQFLWQRTLASTRPDPSDAGMAYFIATGDERCDPVKLEQLIEKHQAPTPLAGRKQIRIEAENFRVLEGCAVEERNDKKASHALSIRLVGGTAGQIRSRFDEPFAKTSASYDVDVRYFDEKQTHCRFACLLNGSPLGSAWETIGEGKGWLTKSVRNVVVSIGDEIRVDVNGAGGRLDYLQLNLLEAAAQAP